MKIGWDFWFAKSSGNCFDYLEKQGINQDSEDIHDVVLETKKWSKTSKWAPSACPFSEIITSAAGASAHDEEVQEFFFEIKILNAHSCKWKM